MRNVITSVIIGFSLITSACSGSADDASSEPTQPADEWVDDSKADFGVAPLGPNPAGEPTRYPIVLAHGLLGSPTGFGGFNPRIVEALRKDGQQVFLGAVPPIASVKDRATYLAKSVDDALAQTGAEKVNIIAHSMGGLDARSLINDLGYGDRVASITTLATPHRGSKVADIALGFTELSPDALNALAKAIGKTYNELAEDTDTHAALYDLTEDAAQVFNAEHPDDPQVYYQSWTGVSSAGCIPNPADIEACDGKLLWHEGHADCMNAILVPSAGILADGNFTPNDGLSTVQSAKWGEFRGCLPADHADEIGVFASGQLNRHTGFDFVRFLRNVAFDLAENGF
jgi:triacylglycerol lipase